MLMEWIEPIIEKRIMEVYNLSEKTSLYMQNRSQFDERLDELIKSIKGKEQACLFEIEINVNIMLNDCIDTAYREGLKDGIMLSQKLQKNL